MPPRPINPPRFGCFADSRPSWCRGIAASTRSPLPGFHPWYPGCGAGRLPAESLRDQSTPRLRTFERRLRRAGRNGESIGCGSWTRHRRSWASFRWLSNRAPSHRCLVEAHRYMRSHHSRPDRHRGLWWRCHTCRWPPRVDSLGSPSQRVLRVPPSGFEPYSRLMQWGCCAARQCAVGWSGRLAAPATGIEPAPARGVPSSSECRPPRVTRGAWWR